MQKKWLIIVVGLLLLVACTTSTEPTRIMVEVTREVPVTVVVTLAPDTSDVVAQAAIATPSATPTMVTPTEVTAEETDIADTISPTPIIGQIYIAEQPFENGRMFWIERTDQIWVLTVDEDDNNIWFVRDDNFEEGMPEFDENIEAPEGLLQPIRGFGTLWREDPEIRQAIGWALAPERDMQTRYEFHVIDGYFDENDTFVITESFHSIDSTDFVTYRLFQGEGVASTWETANQP